MGLYKQRLKDDVYVFANTWNIVPDDFGKITFDNDGDRW